MGKREGNAPVRWRDDTGWECRCESCADKGGGERFWPLTDEFWIKRAGMNRCRACWLERYRREATARRRRDPELARAHDRAVYRRNRKVLLIKRRAYYEANREAIRASAQRRLAERKAA